MALTTSISLAVKATQTASSDLSGVSNPHRIGYSKTLTSGTTTGKADVVWSDTRTLAASANEDLDLAGSLSTALGTVTFAKVKAIIVTADAGNANNVVLGNAASNTFTGPFGAATHTVAVAPGGSVALFAPAAGWTVTAATGDLLRATNSGGGSSVTYSILIVGTSA
jgi:hypothetical protein